MREVLHMKREKELKLVSLRDELLLISLVQQASNFPSTCVAHSLSCLLDETTLLHEIFLGERSNPSDIHHLMFKSYV
jgi:hypothetical protein